MTSTPFIPTERYELGERIAVGGMAEVYRAKAIGAHGFEKPIAIKRVLPQLSRDPEFEQRFIAEAKLAVRLSHANIVQVLDFGHLEGSLFIAMELIDGVDLAVVLGRLRQRGGTMPLPAAFHLAVEMCRGLDFAHQRGVVHRDVSPSNVLLSRAGEVKIADFGIATAVGDGSAALDRHRIMGKWRYMSPEQSRGEPVAAASDVFSAATVLFELFTGDKLFPGENAEAITDNIAHMPLPRPSERRAGLPTRIDDLLNAALVRHPERRMLGAADLVRTLVEISYDSGIVASPLAVAETVRASMAADQPVETPGGRPALDDLIRAQLGGVEPTRATVAGPGRRPGDGAPTAALVRRVDADGVTHLEPERITVAARPTSLKRQPASSDPPPAPFDTAANHASDRGRGRIIGVGAALGVAGAVVAAVALVGRSMPSSPSSSSPPVVTAMDGSRAAVASTTTAAELDIVTNPSGAAVRIDGHPVAGTTPIRAAVTADRAHVVTITAPGHRPHVDDGVTVRSGERLRLSATLVAERARLEVVTVPPGAEVTFAGSPIGVTPVVRDDLIPGPGQLTIDKPGFRSERVDLALVDGDNPRIDRRLRATVRVGRIDVNVVDSWAEVRLGGRTLGRAPSSFRLPLGRHRLELRNPASGKQTMLDVEVRADRVGYYNVDLR